MRSRLHSGTIDLCGSALSAITGMAITRDEFAFRTEGLVSLVLNFELDLMPQCLATMTLSFQFGIYHCESCRSTHGQNWGAVSSSLE